MAYTFSVKLRPGLIKYQVELARRQVAPGRYADRYQPGVRGRLADRRAIQRAGDRYRRERAGGYQRLDSQLWRSRRRPEGQPVNLWCNPVWKMRKAKKRSLVSGAWSWPGAWWNADETDSSLMGRSAGHGLTSTSAMKPIPRPGHHLRTDVVAGEAGQADHGIRGVLWHQGENNQGRRRPPATTTGSPIRIISWKWRPPGSRIFPNIQHYYIFQIWPNPCSMGGRRRRHDAGNAADPAATIIEHGLMSTLGIKPGGRAIIRWPAGRNLRG